MHIEQQTRRMDTKLADGNGNIDISTLKDGAFFSANLPLRGIGSTSPVSVRREFLCVKQTVRGKVFLSFLPFYGGTILFHHSLRISAYKNMVGFFLDQEEAFIFCTKKVLPNRDFSHRSIPYCVKVSPKRVLEVLRNELRAGDCFPEEHPSREVMRSMQEMIEEIVESLEEKIHSENGEVWYW